MRFKIAASLIAVFTAACGGGPSGGGQTTTEQLPALDHHVNVVFWHAMHGGTQKPTLEQITKDFNASQSNVTVQLVDQESYDPLNQKLLAALAAGNPPDMSQCFENWAAKFNQSKALADLTPYINAKDGLNKSELDDIWPVLLKDGQLNGKQYMFPFNKSTYVLYYNEDMLKEAGISDPPKTWDEFADQAKKLTKGPNQWGTDFSLLDGYENIFEAMVAEWGGTMLNAAQTKSTFNQEPGQKALQFWVDLVKSGAAHRVSSREDQGDFGSKHIGLYVSTIAGYSFVQQAVGGKFKWKVAPLPAGPNGQHTEITGTNACIFAKSAKDVQQGAFQFIKYFTSRQPTSLWSQKTGYMPVRKSAFEAMKQDFYVQNPNLKVAVDQLPNAIFGPSVSVWNEAAFKVILTELVNAVDGKKSVKQALDDAAKKVDDLLTTG